MTRITPNTTGANVSTIQSSDSEIGASDDAGLAVTPDISKNVISGRQVQENVTAAEANPSLLRQKREFQSSVRAGAIGMQTGRQTPLGRAGNREGQVISEEVGQSIAIEKLRGDLFLKPENVLYLKSMAMAKSEDGSAMVKAWLNSVHDDGKEGVSRGPSRTLKTALDLLSRRASTNEGNLVLPGGTVNGFMTSMNDLQSRLISLVNEPNFTNKPDSVEGLRQAISSFEGKLSQITAADGNYASVNTILISRAGTTLGEKLPSDYRNVLSSLQDKLTVLAEKI